jgi:hypothetical protein
VVPAAVQMEVVEVVLVVLPQEAQPQTLPMRTQLL